MNEVRANTADAPDKRPAGPPPDQRAAARGAWNDSYDASRRSGQPREQQSKPREADRAHPNQSAGRPMLNFAIHGPEPRVLPGSHRVDQGKPPGVASRPDRDPRSTSGTAGRSSDSGSGRVADKVQARQPAGPPLDVHTDDRHERAKEKDQKKDHPPSYGAFRRDPWLHDKGPHIRPGGQEQHRPNQDKTPRPEHKPGAAEHKPGPAEHKLRAPERKPGPPERNPGTAEHKPGVPGGLPSREGGRDRQHSMPDNAQRSEQTPGRETPKPSRPSEMWQRLHDLHRSGALPPVHDRKERDKPTR
ncbi:hypothetical protein Raf01_93340 [Rugosimonospora africana]|uniref:Uncharacterized protein n=1 Tax=Rugosimonospora africana TaxID=556532 RepID=A0A8J3VVY2_9ACTN|nr:hypothetical protein Raf01_93340 [Rugosimonospora africana]